MSISPKVYVPFVLGLVALAIHWFATGEFSEVELYGLISAFAYAAFGIAAPPAPGVKQAEVERVSRRS